MKKDILNFSLGSLKRQVKTSHIRIVEQLLCKMVKTPVRFVEVRLGDDENDQIIPELALRKNLPLPNAEKIKIIMSAEPSFNSSVDNMAIKIAAVLGVDKIKIVSKKPDLYFVSIDKGNIKKVIDKGIKLNNNDIVL